MATTTTTVPKSILIAGAGIAGPALALLLTNAGYTCTIVERAPDFRSSGQQIDVAGEGLKVIKHLGIEDACYANRVEDDGIKFVDVHDAVLASFAASKEAGSLVKELEILRPDLARVIFEAGRERGGVEYLFGESVAAVKQDEKGVTVTFATSKKEQMFDILVAADGLRSHTRTLAFEDSNTTFVKFNQFAGYFSIPWAESDGTWSRWMNAPGGRCVSTRPNRKRGITSAYLCQITPDAERIATMPVGDAKKEITERFRGVGWETDRILSHLTNPDNEEKGFYCQEVAQSKSQRLVTGRVALLGDAGYCPSPISGQGSTLALVGAYILAGCISLHPNDIERGLREYEKQIRPFIDTAQNLPPGVPWIVNPQTGTGIAVLNQTLKVVGGVVNSGVAGMVGRVLTPLGSLLGGGKAPVLPDFPQIHARGT